MHIIRLSFVQLSFFLLVLVLPKLSSAQCTGLLADAGPDLLSCDSSQMLQIQGSIQGNYTKFFWTPTTGLDNPNSLTPMITYKGKGKYSYKLTAEGISTTNLVVNGNFESGNSSFSSGYNYVSTNTTEGEYYVTSNPQSWNGGFSPCGDHTTGSGNMLLLNGHPVANTNCWCQNVPTVAGRKYQFEFWSQSLYPTNIAQLSVKINGNSIGSTQAGGLCNWVLFTVSFTATGASTQICISEITGVRAGNDFAIDDIALFEKCVSMDDVTVEIVNLTAKLGIIKTPRCSSDPFDLTAVGSSTGADIKYEWSTDVGKFIFTNNLNARAVGSGTYTIKVIYSNGLVSCEKEASIEVMAPELLSGTIVSSGKANCRKDSIKLIADVINGNGSYTYKWLPDSLILSGKNTNEVKVNIANRYTVMITDQVSGCVLNLTYDILPDTLLPISKISSDTLMNCRKSSIQLISTEKDTNLFHILWINPINDTLINFSNIIDSIPGTYKLVVEDRLNHCRDSSTQFIKIDTARPVVDLGPDLTLDCKTDNAFITNILNNQTGSFDYNWTIFGNKNPSDSLLTPKNIKSSGQLKLEMINKINGCRSLDSINIFVNQQTPFLDAGNSESLNCNNSKIDLEAVFTLTDSAQIHWYTPQGSILGNPDNSKIIALQKAWYYVELTNLKNGCKSIDSVFVDQNIVKPFAPTIADQTFSCKDSTVTIDASSSSAGINIIYQWSTSNGLITSGQNTKSIIVAAPGKYLFIVTDSSNGCYDSSSVNVLPDLNKPLIQIAFPDTLSCKRSLIKLNALVTSLQGNPITFQWKNQNGINIGAKDSADITIVTPGLYTLEAIDQMNGCLNQLSVTVAIDTIHPQIEIGPDQIWNCASKIIHLSSITNASQNVKYLWTSNNVVIKGIDTLNVIDIIGPGRYYCLIRNTINGCANIDSVEIIADLQQPLIQLKIPDTITCSKGFIDLETTITSSKYLYTWTTNQGQFASGTNKEMATVSLRGKYYLTVKDTGNLCEISDSTIVIEDRIIPLIDILAPNQLTCKIRQIDLVANITSIDSNSNILWTTKNGNILNNPSKNNITANLAGTYYITAINKKNGCSAIDSVSISENQNIPLEIFSSIQQPKCQNDVGSIFIDSITGGEKPLKYEIDQNNYQAGSPISISSGSHILIVTDRNGCTIVKNFTINQPAATSINLVPKIRLSIGASYILQATFSTPKDSIAWINWSPSEKLSCSDCPNPTISGLLEPTSYTVSYADLNGCIATATIQIEIIGKDIWLPNCFSPNGDDINDYFFPVAVEDSYRYIKYFTIYDRWGNRVFHNEKFQANNPQNGWNGLYKNQALNPSVFAYILEVEWNDGTTTKLIGDVSLLK